MEKSLDKIESLPHPYDIVREEALKLLFTLNGQTPKPETGFILMWLMSHHWSLVSDRQTAMQVWSDLNPHNEGQPVKEAVDFVVELTMRSICQLKFHGIYDSTLESFLLGQKCFSESKAIHDHLREKLPYSKNTNNQNTSRSQFATLIKHESIDYSDLIHNEPWVMICILLTRSGALQEIDQRLERNRLPTKNKHEPRR